MILVHLDLIAEHPRAWVLPPHRPSGEPASVGRLREDARRDDLATLAGILEPSAQVRHDYAVAGFLGFFDAACLRWADRGCPAGERWSLVDAALGALEGALGNWAA